MCSSRETPCEQNYTYFTYLCWDRCARFVSSSRSASLHWKILWMKGFLALWGPVAGKYCIFPKTNEQIKDIGWLTGCYVPNRSFILKIRNHVLFWRLRLTHCLKNGAGIYITIPISQKILRKEHPAQILLSQVSNYSPFPAWFWNH